MRKIADALLGIPAERSQQFQLIEASRKLVLKWARQEHVRLEHIEFVVPFVTTDFSLYAWCFYLHGSDVLTYSNDGTSELLKAKFKSVLSEVGYPSEWNELVELGFASKEEVDRNYEGNYDYFVR